MATEKKNSLRSSTTMTIEEKQKLRRLTKNTKSLDELRTIKAKFYKEHGIRPSRIYERWEEEAKHYKKQ